MSLKIHIFVPFLFFSMGCEKLIQAKPVEVEMEIYQKLIDYRDQEVPEANVMNLMQSTDIDQDIKDIFYSSHADEFTNFLNKLSEYAPGINQELLFSLREQNKKSVSLKKIRGTRTKITFVKNKVLPYFLFSRPSFNSDKTEALIYFERVFKLKYGRGEFIWLKKISGEWMINKQIIFWES